MAAKRVADAQELGRLLDERASAAERKAFDAALREGRKIEAIQIARRAGLLEPDGPTEVPHGRIRRHHGNLVSLILCGAAVFVAVALIVSAS